MMRTILLALLIILILAWYLSFSASRLDRLHHRVETSWEHLDALLQRRAAIALDIVHHEEMDPALKLLITASAYQAREAGIIERSDAETSLSESLKKLRDDIDSKEISISDDLARELREITEKIKVAITIHLEAVNAARRVREKLLIRVFRLAGHAPLPVRYEFEAREL
jgi:hypothetical protein